MQDAVRAAEAEVRRQLAIETPRWRWGRWLGAPSAGRGISL